MYYLLVILVCNNVDGDCVWQRQKGRYETEERCAAAALNLERVIVRTQFKCVVQAK